MFPLNVHSTVWNPPVLLLRGADAALVKRRLKKWGVVGQLYYHRQLLDRRIRRGELITLVTPTTFEDQYSLEYAGLPQLWSLCDKAQALFMHALAPLLLPLSRRFPGGSSSDASHTL